MRMEELQDLINGGENLKVKVNLGLKLLILKVLLSYV